MAFNVAFVAIFAFAFFQLSFAAADSDHARSVDTCYGEDAGQIFTAWNNNQLSNEFCQSNFFGQAWCIESSDLCIRNGGKPTKSGSYMPGVNNTVRGQCSTPQRPQCCWNDYVFCRGQTFNGDNSTGNCMLPSYCPQSSAPSLPNEDGTGGCSGSKEQVCCMGNEQRYTPEVYPCFKGFSPLFDRFRRNNVTLPGIHPNKLINYLPYFGIKYNLLNESGFETCYAANYMAVAVNMLARFSVDPIGTFNTAIAAIKKNQWSEYTVEQLQGVVTRGETMTPRTFAKVMDIYADYVFGGNQDDNVCVAYQKSMQNLGVSNAPCDLNWSTLMTNFDCPPN